MIRRRLLTGLIVLGLLICGQGLLFSEGLRFGLRQLTSKKVDPMEQFLMENELASILADSFQAEVIREDALRAKLAVLGLDECSEDLCLTLLCEEFSLDYLFFGEFIRDSRNNYHLNLTLFQASANRRFQLESQTTSFNDTKKSLETIVRLLKGVFFGINVAVVPKALPDLSSFKEREQQAAGELLRLAEDLRKVKKRIYFFERRIKRIQRTLDRLMKENPKLLDTYQKLLKLSLEGAEVTQ